MIIRRPALRYCGSKWQLAGWIAGHFPAHSHYLEACAGAAAVLLRKVPSKLETLNDLDGDVVNFFEVVRDAPDELIAGLRLTPYARMEFERAWDSAECGRVERARRFFVRSWQGMNGTTLFSGRGWKVQRRAEGRHTPPALDMAGAVEGLYAVAERLRCVQVECCPALDSMRRYDSAETVIYFDPPYVAHTRVNARRYRYEMSLEEHEAAAEWLRGCQAYVVVSGYASAEYAAWYEAEGWRRVDRLARVNGGGGRLESLWLNPQTVAALGAGRLFDEFDKGLRWGDG